MSIPLNCLKGHRLRAVKIKPVYEYRPRSFLWWSWLAEVHVADLVRCTQHACGRAQVVGLDGVYEPAAIAPQPMEPPSGNGDGDGEPREREPVPPLAGALRRARV